MVEASLSGIVLGSIPITLAGLFVTAYPQYRRGDQLDIRQNEITTASNLKYVKKKVVKKDSFENILFSIQ